MPKGRYVLGKCDYNGVGRRAHECAITWELENGRFSMSAEIWNPRKTDIVCGGQCVDDVAAYFPENAKAQRMVELWRRWHLNDMNAGTPAQQAWLKAHESEWRKGGTDAYTQACKALAAAGLNPDPNGPDGKPYTYGTAWLREELPADVIAEVEAW